MMHLYFPKKLALPFFFSVLISFSFSQTSHIGGVVNKYAAVTVIDFCNNKFTVDDASQFSVGQKVMLMQMAGAAIDGSNTSVFGAIANYNNSGNYEVTTIKTIVGNVIEFTFAIVRNYDAAGAVQIVSIPEYHIASVDSALKPIVFTGTKGGVVIVKADTIILNDSVTVKGYGFQGGPSINDSATQACYNSGIGGSPDYYCPTIYCGAAKGNGIGNAGYAYGRGKNANGAGGGNDHNTGGGGGGNFGSGGIGGMRANTSNFNCPGPAPGVGGGALVYSNTANKIFMGGGGGAGDENNSEGTAGAHGGGIVIFMANTLVGNNKRINANGNAQTITAHTDGAGGGGGGGTVLFYIDNYAGNVLVNTCGGRGGNLDNGGAVYCMGPGGGGGGGMLWVKTNAIPANINYVDTGGLNGKNIFGAGPPACPTGTTNGALPGNAGGSLTDLTIISDSVPFVKLALTACCDTTVCPNQPIRMSEVDTSTYPAQILWSNGSTAHSFTQTVSATTPFTVTATDIHGCQLTETHTAIVYNNIDSVTTCCDTTLCPGATASFAVTSPPLSQLTYLWSTGSQTSFITQQIFSSQTFFVTITDQNGCRIFQDADVLVSNTFPAFAVCCDTVLCHADTVSFTASTTATSVNYIWSSGQTTATISPAISASQNFTVTVSNASGCYATASVNAVVNNVPPVFTVCCDTTFCAGATLLANATSDSALTYVWSSGQTISSITQQVFSTQTITVTASNANGCTAQQNVNVTVNNQPPVFSVCCDTSFCASGNLIATTISDSALTYQWSSGQTTTSITQPVSASQSFHVTATDANNCTAEKFVDVVIQNITPVFSLCCDTIVCPKATVNIVVSSPQNSQYNYTWSSGQQTSSIIQQISASQIFTVIVSDADGCTGSAFVNAVVNNSNVDFAVCCDTTVCDGNPVLFTATSAGNLNYVWSTGENTSSISPTISSLQIFSVTATSNSGCSSSKSVEANISVLQTTVTANPDSNIVTNQIVQLFATGDSGSTYVWLPIEGLDNANSQNPKATVQTTTTYCVTVTDIYGCTATACHTIEINLPDIKIPDAFSPNGDGVNDEFIVFPLSSEIVEIKIYNRWGEVVFTSKGNATWNGTFKGSKQEAGNFVCAVTYTNAVNTSKINRVVKDIILVR